jgi:CubicO group peptidase (beta-lactamase class C family)
VAERYAPGFSADMPLPGWSMTKSVIGALVGILVGAGRLSPSARELLPEWPASDDRSGIRLEDLLRMRSGLEFFESYFNMSSHVVQMLFNRPDAGAYAASLRLAHRPGTTWSYASGTTNILSRIVRRAVGEADYPEFPRRALFDPIGMRSATLEPDASGTFVGSSFMLATARDWARFGQLHLQDGVWAGQRVLPEGWVRFSTTPTPQSPGGCYGAHWWLKLQKEMGGESGEARRIPADAYFALGHEGQTLSVIPSRGLVVVRLGLSVNIEAWNHAAFLADLHAVI